MLVLNARGYSLVRSEPIHAPNQSGKMLILPLSNATNLIQIGSEMPKNKHFIIVPELWITLYINNAVSATRGDIAGNPNAA